MFCLLNGRPPTSDRGKDRKKERGKRREKDENEKNSSGNSLASLLLPDRLGAETRVIFPDRKKKHSSELEEATEKGML